MLAVADVNVLFDDGVEYTAPVVSVRKRVSILTHTSILRTSILLAGQVGT